MQGMVKVQVLRAACCVAGSDGTADPSERRIVEMLAREIGVGEASLGAMLERARTEENYVEDQFRVLKADAKQTMQLLFSVALADGELADDEVDVLRNLSTKLNVTTEQFDNWYAEATALSTRRNQ